MTTIVDTGGASLRVEDNGAGPSSSAALLFLHYWGGSAQTWRKVIDQLSDIRCVAASQRGWGGSTARDERYDLETMADDVNAIIHQLRLPEVVLVGHSMGGKVAQIVAKRQSPGVRGLVLVAPGPPTAMPVPAEAREAMLKSYQSASGVDDALANLAGPTVTPDERESVRADTLAGEPGAKEEWPRRGMVADLGLHPGDIKIPVTLLVGSLDKVERPDRQRAIFGEKIPQTRFIEIPGVGHLSPLEAPDVIASACRDMVARVSAF